MFLPLIIGFLFGFLLQRTGLGHSYKVTGQFTFRDNTMLKFMVSALASGMITVSFFTDAGMLSPSSMPDTYAPGNIIGGAILGIGMAIAGVCPGTLITGIGQGNIDYLIPGVLGFLTGGVLFGYSFNPHFLKLSAIGFSKGLTMAQLTGAGHWIFSLEMLIIAASAFLITRKFNI
ncbi:MAG: YeeE/YedE thiosulfate transporter family protein [Deferribacterales bacterium]